MPRTLLCLALFGLLCHTVVSAGNKFNVQTHAIYLKEPSDIAGEYEGAIGDFGIPLYGGSLSGRVVFPDENRNGCKEYRQGTFTRDYGSDEVIIALVERGDCYFAEKALNAQKAGASAAIIVDTKFEPLITMTTPQDKPSIQALIKEIEIPTALVAKKVGDQMVLALAEGKAVLLEMNWEESMINPDDRVEWELWTTSNDACGPSCEQQAEFKENAAEIAMELERQGFTEFKPHFKIRSCDGLPAVKEAGCNDNCIHNGRYCAGEHISSPYDETYKVRDVMLENKRQLCIFDYLKRSEQPGLWWKYASEFAKRCKIEDGNFGGDCSREIQKELKVSDSREFLMDVTRCMGDSNADEPHPLLEREKKYEMDRFRTGHGHIAYLPSILINTIQYRGRLDKASILRGICAGFKETSEPGVCLQDALQVNECDSGHSCWINPNASLAEEFSSTCLDTFRGHICMCPKGYIGDGYYCEEINECGLGTHDCDHTCINTVGGYRCECEEGFVKVGHSQCVRGDECEVNNGGCQHHCTWSITGPKCSCDHGFELTENGKTCVDIDECARGEHECDQVCINTDPRHSAGLAYVCGCFDGYTLDLQDPLLQRCIKNDNLLKHWGVDAGGKSTTFTALEITLIVLVSVTAVFVLGYVLYRWRFKRSMNSEIRSILQQYVPLDDKPLGKGKANAVLNTSSSSTSNLEQGKM
eukprot:CAMPEP_0197471192 /NCGR_PEP_ID=MMETSP1309-20131121/2084_1 /TAXON_ID=464262 /ORGANISM="Genus nov. species nov., Strain RCC998" /LENGTH=698 /DNA_ID=CAMNT_0043008705 /DNA_START=311 /DNA_END=2407 /DNA_ORIENTATION=+